MTSLHDRLDAALEFIVDEVVFSVPRNSLLERVTLKSDHAKFKDFIWDRVDEMTVKQVRALAQDADYKRRTTNSTV